MAEFMDESPVTISISYIWQGRRHVFGPVHLYLGTTPCPVLGMIQVNGGVPLNVQGAADPVQSGKPNVQLFALSRSQLGDRYFSLAVQRPAEWSFDPAAVTLQQVAGMDPEIRAAIITFAPQGSPLWHAGRQGRITASTFGTYFGFAEPEAAKYLSVPAYMSWHDKVALLLGNLREQQQQENEAALQWGQVHEPNCMWTVMNMLWEIPGFEKALQWSVLEQGFIQCADREGMPPLGASPDGMLVVQLDGEAQPMWIMLEFKARFPFNKAPATKENTHEGDYVYAPYKPFAEIMPPMHYAQVQLGMHATSTSKCLYLQYTVEQTSIWVVDFDAAWINYAMGQEDGGVAGRIWRQYFEPGVAPPQDFGKTVGAEDYARLLECTKAGCERAIMVKRLQSVKGQDIRKFV